MVPPPRHGFLVWFLALAPSLVIYKSLTIPAPPHHDEEFSHFPPPIDDGTYLDVQKKQYTDQHSTGPVESQNFEGSPAVPQLHTISNNKEVCTFAACLLIMDDNSILPEFLAYHYLRLPLRRLIVAIDPRSETSPSEILQRYSSRGLMNITIWNDDDFIPSNHKEVRAGIDKDLREKKMVLQDPLVSQHRDRQSYFISQCFNTLRREGTKWVIHLDTDEYILPNYFADTPYKLNVSAVPRLNATLPPTIYDMIQSVEHIDGHLSSPCISLPRVRIGTRESNTKNVNKGLPEELDTFINTTNLQTFRWRWRNKLKTGLKSNGRAKAMVDVSRLSHRSMRRNVLEHNPHRPVAKECLVRNMYLDARNSTFLVHHYAGSWKQWSARTKDARQTTENNGRTREAWEKLKTLSVRQTDDIRPWLQDLVEVYGATLAKELLKGIGE